MPMAANFLSAMNGRWSRGLTFEEGYELDKPFIASFAFPRLHNDCVFRVSSHVFGVRVKLDAYMT